MLWDSKYCTRRKSRGGRSHWRRWWFRERLTRIHTDRTKTTWRRRTTAASVRYAWGGWGRITQRGRSWRNHYRLSRAAHAYCSRCSSSIWPEADIPFSALFPVTSLASQTAIFHGWALLLLLWERETYNARTWQQKIGRCWLSSCYLSSEEKISRSLRMPRLASALLEDLQPSGCYCRQVKMTTRYRRRSGKLYPIFFWAPLEALTVIKTYCLWLAIPTCWRIGESKRPGVFQYPTQQTQPKTKTRPKNKPKQTKKTPRKLGETLRFQMKSPQAAQYFFTMS